MRSIVSFYEFAREYDAKILQDEIMSVLQNLLLGCKFNPNWMEIFYSTHGYNHMKRFGSWLFAYVADHLVRTKSITKKDQKAILLDIPELAIDMEDFARQSQLWKIDPIMLPPYSLHTHAHIVHDSHVFVHLCNAECRPLNVHEAFHGQPKAPPQLWQKDLSLSSRSVNRSLAQVGDESDLKINK